MRFAGFAAAALLVGSCVHARGAGIDSGPYLMHATTTGVTACWVSDQPAAGAVQVAGQPAPVLDAGASRYHRLKVTGLKPYTRYAYAVSCADWPSRRVGGAGQAPGADPSERPRPGRNHWARSRLSAPRAQRHNLSRDRWRRRAPLQRYAGHPVREEGENGAPLL